MEGAFEFVCVDGTTWRCSSSPLDFMTSVADPTVPNTVMVPKWTPGGFGPAQWTVEPLTLTQLADMGALSPGDGQVIFWDASVPGWSAKNVADYLPLNSFTGDVGIGDESQGIFLVDADGAPRTVTLPSALYGLRITVKKVDAAADALTLETPDAALIDGSATYLLEAQNDFVSLISDGTNWWVEAKSAPPAVSPDALLFVGDTSPTVDAGTKYVWIETGLGVGGDDMTIWVEDGV
jgi:hypothetical protein